MEILKHDGNFPVDEAIEANEPMMAVISFDGKKAVICQVDEGFEHYILLQKVGISGADIDKYFRIIFDKEGADWTFVCPPNYKNITDKTRRVSAFYKDGFTVISGFLSEIGYLCDLNIPKRYRRHLETLE